MSITMYSHHEVLDHEAMAQGPPPEMHAAVEERGIDMSEAWYATDDAGYALAVIEYGSSADLVAHLEILDRFGYREIQGTIFEATVDVVGDLDDDAREVLSTYDFIHVMSPMPEG